MLKSSGVKVFNSTPKKMGAQADTEKAKSHSPEYDEKIVGFPKRYLLALMIFLGFCVLYALRVNLNVAIGAMCNNHTIYVNGFYVKKVAEFNWDSKLQGTALHVS